MTLPTKTKFDPAQNITNADRKADQLFRDYMLKLDTLVAAIAAGNAPSNLVAAADDAAAAAAGVPLGGIYRSVTSGAAPHTVSFLQVRVS